MLQVVAIGFLFGFFGSVPTSGPGSVVVFARAAERRWWGAFYLGLGCGVAEGAYAGGVFACFSTFLADHPLLVPISSGFGALTLWSVGLYYLLRKDRAAEKAEPRDHKGGSFLTGVVITALNPALIATWAAASAVVFSAGLVESEGILAIPFGLAAAIGVIVWYGILVRLMRRHRDRFSTRTLQRVIRIMGGLLLCIGSGLAWRFVSALL